MDNPTAQRALLLSDALELQQTLISIQNQLQANVVQLSKQMQMGLTTIAHILDSLSNDTPTSTTSKSDGKEKQPDMDDKTIIVQKERAHSAIPTGRAVSTIGSPSVIPSSLDISSQKQKTPRRFSFAEANIHSRYQYHPDLLTLAQTGPKNTLSTASGVSIGLTQRVQSTVSTADSHLTMGLKWDSTDYILASKREPSSIERRNLAVFSDPTLPGANDTSVVPTVSVTDERKRRPSIVKKSANNLGLWLSKAFSVGAKSTESLPMYSNNDVQQHGSEEKHAQYESSSKAGLGTFKAASRKVEPYDDERRDSLAVQLKVPKLQVGKKWEQLRAETIRRQSQALDPGFSSIVTAAFPELQTTPEEKKAKARQQWNKVKKTVLQSDRTPGRFEIISSLAITALPDIEQLNQKLEAQSPPSPQLPTVESYNTIKYKLHWIFLCPAFGDDGRFISMELYHQTDFRPHNLWTDGFHPMSLFCVILNFFLICFYAVILIVIPYQIAYNDTVDTIMAQEFIIFGVFCLDTIICAITPLPPQKTDTRNKVKRPQCNIWAWEYMKRYLLLDIISLIPFAIFLPLGQDNLPFTLIHLIRMIHFPHMLARAPMLIVLNRKLNSILGIGNILTRMLPVGAAVLYFVHLQTCILYYLGKIYNFQTWDSQFSHWQFYPGGINAAPISERYTWMLTQSIGNIFQLTFKPETLLEQAATMVFIVIGALLYATLVGLISSAAISYDASGSLYRQKVDELTEYLTWKNIDNDTKRRLLNYYEFKYKGKYFEEMNLLADLNHSLRRELAAINCKQLIEKVPFLKRERGDGRDALYIGKISTALVPVYFIPGDVIISQGEQATEMYFILTGKVDILVNNQQVSSFSDGGFFGEVALIANIPRTASVVAATVCKMYTLSAKDFNAILLEFDDMKLRIDKIYEARMAKVRMEQTARLFMDRRPSQMDTY